MPTFTPTRLTRWEHWQGSPVSKKLLSQDARSQGYAVLWVMPKCRMMFLSLAYLVALYGYLRHRHRPLAPALHHQVEQWLAQTEDLITHLEEALDG